MLASLSLSLPVSGIRYEDDVLSTTCQVQNSAGLCPADVNDCRPVFILCTAFIRRHPFLPSCTYPPRAPGTPFAVRYYSTELAPDMEEEEEEDILLVMSV